MTSGTGGATRSGDVPDEGSGGEATGDADRYTGQDVERREDAGLLTGRAEYTDDLSVPDAVHLSFVRSHHGHARIGGIDVASAESMDGVLAVYTWEDVEASDAPGVLPLRSGGLDHEVPGHPMLARDRVRYHGQPVAAVVAEDRYRARDGIEAVEVEYDPLDAVVDPVEAASEDAPTLYDGVPDNVVARTELGNREAVDEEFAAADLVVDLDLENNRLIPSALEPRVALARYDAAEDRLRVDLASQAPHGHRRKLAHTLGVPERKLRVVSPAVGGGFGHKGHHHPGEAMAAWAARRLERPVEWTATRRDNYLEGAHGRDHVTEAAIAVEEDGAIRGLRVDTHASVGGYGLGSSLGMPGWYGRLLSSEYEIPAIHCETRCVFTNTAPIHSYRGAGRPESIYVTERLVDAAARELGMDPVEVRRRNLIDPDDFPHETAVGATYDSGDYEPALEKALDGIGYDDLRDRGRERADGRLRGVGVACYVESTGGGHESGLVRVHPDGGVSVYAGTHSHGQGHGTTYAQLVADELGVDYDRVEVAEGDTEQIPTGTGTFGSRSTITGGNAVVESAREVLAKARQVAADELDADSSVLAREDGDFHVRGDPDRSVSFDEVARRAYGGGLPGDLDPGLEATTFYEPDGTAYTFGTHAAEVAIDPDTGELELLRYVAVDDCGERVNPRIVEGQVHGGVAQGVGQARSERVVYDDAGRLRTDSMLDYAVPRASHLPDVETDATVTPSPRNDLGVKGIGEAGTIAAPPTVVNAVVDALAGFGIDHVDMPVTDEAIWRAIRAASDD